MAANVNDLFNVPMQRRAAVSAAFSNAALGDRPDDVPATVGTATQLAFWHWSESVPAMDALEEDVVIVPAQLTVPAASW